jgi:L-cysteine S-thiosulfotransferase
MRLLAAGLLLLSLAASAQEPRRSGSHYMSPATQAMQKDDAANPGFLWVNDGRKRFEATCSRCHAPDSAASLRGVAARYPAWDERLAQPLTLAGRINQCQQRHVKAEPLAAESDALLGIEAFVALQSRGLPIAPPADARLAPARTQGARLYQQRFGQLDFSCAMCHDRVAGQRLAGSTIPQGHPTAYPLYRLEWQALGSLQRRLRHCMSGVRAEPFAYGSAELTAIELYLMQRAAGMPLETPGVRP